MRILFGNIELLGKTSQFLVRSQAMWLQKFNLLLWKNWILIKRHPVAVTFELIFPIAVIIFFAWIRNVAPTRIRHPIESKEFNIYSKKCNYGYQEITRIGFAPKNPFYSNLMDQILTRFNTTEDAVEDNEYESYTDPTNESYAIFGFEDEHKLDLWIQNQSNPVLAVIFEHKKPHQTKHLMYKILVPYRPTSYSSWYTDQLYYISTSTMPRNSYGNDEDPPYLSVCFLKLQNEIDQAFIRAVGPKSSFKILKYIKSFPYPSVEIDFFVEFAVYGAPVLFVLCMIFSAKVLIKNITIERESRLKESMKIMGLSSTQYWSSWFVRSFAILSISFTINLIFTTTTIISEHPMFPNSNPLLIWIFFISYITSMITFCFLVSVVFKKSSRAGTVGSILFITTIMPYMIYTDTFNRFSYGLKALFCMLTNTNMGQGIKMILMAEVSDDGVGFSNLFKRHIDYKFSFGELLIFINIGSVLMMLLTMYIEKVFPGDFGIPKKWYFPISSILKKITKKSAKLDDSEISDLIDPLFRPADHEEEPINLKIGIEIKSLSKKFGNKFAVKNLSLNLYEGQITVLLGHNGAGKTTAMSMLTGLFQPTAGTAIINGCNLLTNLDEARQSLGFCPQHDVLFEELTVQEHLEFFCKLKGMTDEDEIKREVLKYSDMLGISEKIDAESKTLSGGQKRRLSIAIALCGNSKFVIMDEATSGMDPSSRRHLWDLLIAEKKNRTILISTHFMDEADVLGDRIAIMSDGQLRTVGSSFFLKKRFGTGYRLTCVKQKGFDSNDVLDAIEEHAPEAFIESEGKTEAVFVISKEKLPFFDQIFETLELRADELKISSFGCNFSSLEDVFLKIGYGTFEDSQLVSESQAVEVENQKVYEKDEQSSLICYQIYAMALKKFFVYRRMWKSFVYYIILSAIALFVIPKLYDESFNTPPELRISLDTYEETETLMQAKSNAKNLSKFYSHMFEGKNKITKVTGDLEKIIHKMSNESLGTVIRNNLIAVSFESKRIVGWFNTQPYHTMPLTVNTINRAILKSVVGNEYEISVTNKPYLMTLDESFERKKKDINVALDFGTILFLMFVWSLIYVRPNIKEREMRFKFLQYICGTNRLVFWLTSFIFDYILFVLICLVAFGCLSFEKYDDGYSSERFTALMIIGMSYGFALIPFIYAFSYLFTKPSTGEVMLQFVMLIFQILVAVYFSFQNIEKFEAYMKLFYWIGMLFAPFTLTHSLVWYAESSFNFLIKRRYSIDSESTDKNQSSMFDYSSLNDMIIMNILSGCIFLTLILLEDYNFFAYLYYKFQKPQDVDPSTESNVLEVQLESIAVSAMSSEDIKSSNLVLKNLKKTFKNFSAVKDLSLNINKHECFGLLGVNGAGKTTTFKMMTGDELITSGDIWIKGNCLKTQLLDAHKFIGYCPQFENCIPELTGRETLKIFALIRGIKMDEINELIDEIANELDFKTHLDKQVRAYSGGNRRKLSTALALLGNPELIFLDECTTGVDPQARRQIWNAIKKIRDNHRLSSSIVLTSHSMDECEALCTRIGIMVAGQFQCLGPIQHLKNKYSKGFVLTIKTGFNDENSITNVKQRVSERFSGTAELKESYLDILTFHLKDINLKYSKVFKVLAEVKEETGIKDYALTQMSLEQVFLNISHHEQ